MVLHYAYGPTLCLSIDTHIRSNFYRVVYFFSIFIDRHNAGP